MEHIEEQTEGKHVCTKLCRATMLTGTTPAQANNLLSKRKTPAASMWLGSVLR
jgi:hypothetical protein